MGMSPGVMVSRSLEVGGKVSRVRSDERLVTTEGRMRLTIFKER